MGEYLPVGVCLLPEPGANVGRTVSYSETLIERLQYWGLPFSRVQVHELLEALPQLKVLVTVGESLVGVLPDLSSWLETGGTWVAVGGTAGMPGLLGVEPVPPAFSSWGGGVGMLGEGWMHVSQPHPVTGHITIPLHYFNGAAMRLTGRAEVLAVAESRGSVGTERPAVVLSRHGKGRALLIAPDLPGTVVRIRQGIAVTRDGVPAPDGTAPICDGVLKSDDGAVLDWERDRQPSADAPGLKCFLTPIADQWEELLVRAVLWGAAEAGCELPVLWFYPRNLPAVAVLSHDSDGNDPSRAKVMMDILAQHSIRSTWCLLAPGYPKDVIDALRQAGHELAMHFDAMSEGRPWSQDEFARQHRAIIELIGSQPCTNKNHFLRWEGDTDFYEWCHEHGVRMDQSKGASKTGEAGFNFGTCHLYRPVRRDGSVIDVWEMPTPTQDLVVFAPAVLGDALREAVRRAHGIYHLLFHPAHIETTGVADALRGALLGAVGAGLEWWTAAEVLEWTDARMAVHWEPSEEGCHDGVSLSLMSAKHLLAATILWPDPAGPVERFGFRFRMHIFDVSAGEKKVIDREGGVRV